MVEGGRRSVIHKTQTFTHSFTHSPNNDILVQPITTKEIHEQISKLKLKKASGMECIVNEMIKHGRYYLMPSFENPFNDILNSDTFPTHWNIGVINRYIKERVISGLQQIIEESH